MLRLVFEKTGNAVWISHLDLMRLFQRAFKRAGLLLKHTQGFSPRPSVSIALPLSVGIESQCELLDFELEIDGPAEADIQDRLNAVLVPGVRILRVYRAERKIKELQYLQCRLFMRYDQGVPDDAVGELLKLFHSRELLVEKRGKNGVQRQDIIPMLKQLEVQQTDSNTLTLDACVCCQNPSLNPMQLVAAIEAYLPQYKPDFVKCKRLALLDQQYQIFQ